MTQPLNRSIVSIIRDNIFRIGSAVLLVGAVVLWVCTVSPVKYRSSVILGIDGASSEPLVASVKSEQVHHTPTPTERKLSQMARGSEMLDHLIAHFSLLAHYRINEADPLKIEKAYWELERNIEPMATESGLLTIRVSDKDPEMAAAMANEIASELQRIVQTEAAAELDRRAAMYAALVDKERKLSAEQSAALASLLAANADNNPLEPAQIRLSELITRMAGTQDDLRRFAGFYEVASLLKNAPVNIRSIRKATRDVETSPVIWTLVIVLFAMFATAVVTSYFAVAWDRHGSEVITLLTEPPPQPGRRIAEEPLPVSEYMDDRTG